MLHFFEYKIFQITDTEQFLESLSGDGKKGILVVLLDEGLPEGIVFLKKILSSIRIDLEKDALLFRAAPHGILPTVAQLKSVSPIEKVLVFGVSPQRLGFTFEYPMYKRLILNDCQYVFANKLSFLEPNKQAKNDLWKQLQLIFANT
jgi:DNA polymerase III psi subunit